MIDIKQQEEIFIAIGNILDKKLVVYAIGGTAMMLRNIKDSTLDVDFVFEKKRDKEKFINALRTFGAADSDVTLVYGLKKNTPIMLKLGNVRFDLFMSKVITSTFSEKMKSRARQTHEFGKNLIVEAADPNDIIIMKSATSRAKDLEDITLIAKKNPVNWDIILDEAKEQVALGNETAVMSLREKLEKLNNQKAIVVPNKTLDSLWHLLKKQIKAKTTKSKKKASTEKVLKVIQSRNYLL